MITQDELAIIMEEVFQECKELRGAGQKEYAHDKVNALRNFEVLAGELQLSREKVLFIYLKKHIDGILAHINGHKSQREDVEGRINDAIVYLVILRAMVQDEKDTYANGIPTQTNQGYANSLSSLARLGGIQR